MTWSERDVDVVRPGQVAAGAHERVLVEDVEDARDGQQDVVLGDLDLVEARDVDVPAARAAALAVAVTVAVATPTTSSATLVVVVAALLVALTLLTVGALATLLAVALLVALRLLVALTLLTVGTLTALLAVSALLFALALLLALAALAGRAALGGRLASLLGVAAARGSGAPTGTTRTTLGAGDETDRGSSARGALVGGLPRDRTVAAVAGRSRGLLEQRRDDVGSLVAALALAGALGTCASLAARTLDVLGRRCAGASTAGSTTFSVEVSFSGARRAGADAPAGRPEALVSPEVERMTSTRSLLRILDVPFTPSCEASACSSGRRSARECACTGGVGGVCHEGPFPSFAPTCSVRGVGRG